MNAGACPKKDGNRDHHMQEQSDSAGHSFEICRECGAVFVNVIFIYEDAGQAEGVQK